MTWLEHKTLSIEQRKYISKSILPKIDESALERLFDCIETAWTHDPLYQVDTDLTPSELESELRKTIGSLDKAISRIKLLDKHNEGRLIDQHFVINTDLYLRPLIKGASYSTSITHWLLSQVRESTYDRAEEVREARGANGGETRGKNYKIEHWSLLRDLIRFFEEHIPSITPSSSDNAPFYNLVNYLFSEVMEFETKDAKRQINNALKITKTGTPPSKNLK